jgi:beta-phosphoglucomutase
MDGVLVDSNPFHLEKWIELLSRYGIPFDRERLPAQVLGQRNDVALRRFFGTQLSREERRRMSEELEARFREAFRPHARPLPGLMALLEECGRAGIAMAVASSAMRKNVEFVVETLELAPCFRALVSGDEVSRPKPDPEIYLAAAERLGVRPMDAVAFEDSFIGIAAAKRAGMKCVAIASSFPFERLRDEAGADCVVRSFEAVTLARLRQLFGAASPGITAPSSNSDSPG